MSSDTTKARAAKSLYAQRRKADVLRLAGWLAIEPTEKLNALRDMGRSEDLLVAIDRVVDLLLEGSTLAQNE